MRFFPNFEACILPKKHAKGCVKEERETDR